MFAIQVEKRKEKMSAAIFCISFEISHCASYVQRRNFYHATSACSSRQECEKCLRSVT
jgi:hypothetical protein